MSVTVVIRTGATARDAAPALTFDGDRVVIGRSSGSDVRLPDPSVSLRHASIRAQGAEYSIVDERSTNGTFVGSSRLDAQTPRALRSGDLVRLGRVWLEIVIDQKPATPDLGTASRELALRLVRQAMQGLGDEVVAKIRGEGTVLSLLEEGKVYVIDAEPRAGFVRRGSQVLVRDLGGDVFVGENQVKPERDVVWRVPARVQVGERVFELDDPVSVALAELEAEGDERLPEGVAPPVPGEAPKVAAEPIAPPVVEPPPAEPRPKNRPGRTWTKADISLVILALVVIGMSAAGLAWVLR